MKGFDRRRYFQDFIKVGRVGSQYKVFGAPGKLEGPYGTPQEAQAVMEMIIDSPDKFEVVDRKIVKKKKEK